MVVVVPKTTILFAATGHQEVVAPQAVIAVILPHTAGRDAKVDLAYLAALVLRAALHRRLHLLVRQYRLMELADHKITMLFAATIPQGLVALQVVIAAILPPIAGRGVKADLVMPAALVLVAAPLLQAALPRLLLLLVRQCRLMALVDLNITTLYAGIILQDLVALQVVTAVTLQLTAE